MSKLLYLTKVDQEGAMAAGTKKRAKNQTVRHISAIYHTIHHISMLFIPEIWRGMQYIVILQCDFFGGMDIKN